MQRSCIGWREWGLPDGERTRWPAFLARRACGSADDHFQFLG